MRPVNLTLNRLMPTPLVAWMVLLQRSETTNPTNSARYLPHG